MGVHGFMVPGCEHVGICWVPHINCYFKTWYKQEENGFELNISFDLIVMRLSLSCRHSNTKGGKKCPSFCFFPLEPVQAPSGILSSHISLNHRYWERSGRQREGLLHRDGPTPRYAAAASSLQVRKSRIATHRLCFKCRTWKASDSTPVN